MDKVDPVINNADLYGDGEASDKEKLANAYERKIHNRKQAIINIIAGLKNFFTTANARFVFIAGNEMFDASLADISDRQSAISSIFTYVFNIESLLKEKDLIDGQGTVNSLSLSDGIELYLKVLLFKCDQEILKKQESLYEMAMRKYRFQKLVSECAHIPYENWEDTDNKKDNDSKIYFILQNFITYLTYRSNGSTKKLIREIHEFIKVGSEDRLFSEAQTVVGIQTGFNKKKERRFLYFNYYNQYRIGFINYLYRPFLIKYGRSFKLYSDNVIVSTPYLFDHLIKFHPFAFSMSNLELVPELLSNNKTPALRLHIKKIIEYLGANHIREIEVGLFDFKFNSRTLNEITYLSKIYEQEAAAFNYTLDESYLVKLHVINKIRDLRNVYAKVHTQFDAYKQIFSIAHLNATLGDLHFFDQEYDDAIVAYLDAIRPLTQQPISSMNLQDFITLNRNRLKIGLSFEKINSYEDALAHYANTCMDAVRFMKFRIDSEVFLTVRDNEFADDDSNRHQEVIIEVDRKKEDKALYHSAALSDLLQIILQGFLAQLFIQEKKSVAGISTIKLFMVLGSYFTITKGFLSNSTRNHIIKANAYLHAGNLMYYKNTDVNKIMPEDFKNLVPDEIVDHFNSLHRQFSDRLGQGKMPVMSLFLYVLALLETSAYGNDRNYLQNSVTRICANYNISFYLLKYFKEDVAGDGEHFRSIRYNYIATCFSNIGDNLLSLYRQEGEAQVNYNQFKIADIFDLSGWEKINELKKECPKTVVSFDLFIAPRAGDENETTTFRDILNCYFLAGRYYQKQGRTASTNFEYNKILYVLRMILNDKDEPAVKQHFVGMLEMTIIKPVLQLTGKNAEHTDRHMLAKAERYKLDSTHALSNLSNHPETREPILLFNYIKIRIGAQFHSYPPFKNLISPNHSFATQHGRILELSFYARYMEEIIAKDKLRYLSLSLERIAEDKELVENAVNYLYCRLSILQIMDIYGADYWLGYSYIAFTHMIVAKYLIYLNLNKDLKNVVLAKLDSFLGKGSYTSLDPTYHFSKALVSYEKAVQLHTGGDAYRNMIEDLIYLEDDFNESAYHFGAAYDRYLQVNGVFDDRIKYCQKKINKDKDFKPEKYLGS